MADKKPLVADDWQDDPGDWEDEVRPDWGDAANTGASVQQAHPGPESIAEAPYGPEENPRPIGRGEAFLRHFGQGGLKQGSDELSGSIIAGVVGSDGTRGPLYRKYRDNTRADLDAAQDQHPWLSMGANMAGDIASDYVLNAFGVPVTSQGYQIASGALTGLLNGDADLTQPTPESVMQAGEETALGGAAAYALPMVGRYVGSKAAPHLARGAEWLSDAWHGSAVNDWLENLARERALKASGFIPKDFARGAPQRERLISGAQELLDEPGLIGPFSSKAAIADRLEPLVDREGKRIGAALDAADEASLSGPMAGRPFNPLAYAAETERLKAGGAWQGGPFNPYEFITDARTNVVAPFVDNPSTKTAGEGVGDWLTNLEETSGRLESRGEPFTFRRANEYKGDLQDAVFNSRGDVKPTVNARAQNDLQRRFTRSIDDQAAPLLGPEQLAQFQDARRKFGAFKGAFGKATEGANRDVGNNALGLKDWQAAQAFAQAAENTPGLGWAAPIVAVGSKVFRGRGDSLAAYTADGLAKADWLQSLATTQPEVLGKWGQYLTAAAARSPEALGQLHSSLAETDPEYQQRMRLLGGQQE